MLQAGVAGVRSGVIALSTPNHPLRLAGLFGASVAFFAIVASAAGAMAYVVRDARSSGGIAGQSANVPTQAQMQLPAGVIALQRVADAGEFRQLAGFKPFIPKQLPEHTRGDISLSVALPDDHGVRAGRVGYSAADAAGPGGITGPMVVLFETKGVPPAAADGQFTRVAGGNGRGLIATIGCRGLVLDVQLYFGPAPAPGEPYVTPYMTATAQKFLDGLKQQCGD